jgi:hypothetical protein
MIGRETTEMILETTEMTGRELRKWLDEKLLKWLDEKLLKLLD